MPRVKPTHWLIEFTVRGNGYFPIDMLRYDNAWPASESDSHLIQLDRIAAGKDEWLKPRNIKLQMASCNGLGPTSARWNSFTWEVVEVAGRRVF